MMTDDKTALRALAKVLVEQWRMHRNRMPTLLAGLPAACAECPCVVHADTSRQTWPDRLTRPASYDAAPTFRPGRPAWGGQKGGAAPAL